MVAANSRTQTLWFLLAPGKEGGLKECETYKCDGGSDWELSASPTTKQKGHEVMDREARGVFLEQSQLPVEHCMEDPCQIPRKVATNSKGSSWSVGQWVRLRKMHPPTSSHPWATKGAAKLVPGSQAQLCCSPSPHSCLRTAAATANFPMLLRSLEPLLGCSGSVRPSVCLFPPSTCLSYVFSGHPLPELGLVLAVGKKSAQ